MKKRKPKKVSKNKWRGLKETSQYEFDLFHDIAYVFYLLDIHPHMGYANISDMASIYQQINNTINSYAKGVEW